MLAGHLAGVPVIGYANKPGKIADLTRVQAATVPTSLAEITTALRATPVTPGRTCGLGSYEEDGRALARRTAGVQVVTRSRPASV